MNNLGQLHETERQYQTEVSITEEGKSLIGTGYNPITGTSVRTESEADIYVNEDALERMLTDLAGIRISDEDSSPLSEAFIQAAESNATLASSSEREALERYIIIHLNATRVRFKQAVFNVIFQQAAISTIPDKINIAVENPEVRMTVNLDLDLKNILSRMRNGEGERGEVTKILMALKTMIESAMTTSPQEEAAPSLEAAAAK